MVMRQGDVFWVDIRPPVGSEPGYRRPCVVVQSDRFNDTALQTVVVCVITGNVTLALHPGNVALRRGDGGLSRNSTVNVTQLFTVDKRGLTERAGMLPAEKMSEVLAGIRRVLEPRSTQDQ